MPNIVIVCFNTNFGLKSEMMSYQKCPLHLTHGIPNSFPALLLCFSQRNEGGLGGILVVWFKIFPDLLQQHSAWHFQIPNLVCEFLEGELLAQFHHLKCTN